MALHWFGVKSLYETVIQVPSKPRQRRGGVSRSSRVLTERVVLIRARDFDDAIRKAEKDAKAYVKRRTVFEPWTP